MNASQSLSSSADTVVDLSQTSGEAPSLPLRSNPMLAAMRKAGTLHVYGDTVDSTVLKKHVLLDGSLIEEVDGSTANQPLMQKVIDRYLEGSGPAEWNKLLKERSPGMSDEQRTVLLYMILCGRASTDMVRAMAQGRDWEVSIQLHMSLAQDLALGTEFGHLVRRMVPGSIVKVPFLPHAPQSILLARDLEREGVPVNLTSTFSARQTVTVAVLANVARTNIFMGRINQGMQSKLLGEHVDLEAQRHIRRLRTEYGCHTQLIIASIRDWQTFAATAGCDVYTAPLDPFTEFLEQTEIGPEQITSKLETSYEDELGIDAEVIDALGMDRISRLYKVEPELIEFLTSFRRTAEFARMNDGDALYKRFDQEGFGDIFCCPSDSQWAELKKAKLPDINTNISKEIALDTLYTLLADADFEKYQVSNDAAIAEAVAR